MQTDVDTEAIEIELPEPAETFHIDSDEKVNWLVKKIVGTYVVEERARRWSELELRRAARERDWLFRRFGTELEAWLQDRLKAERGRRKSIALPGGTVGYRTDPPRLHVIDEMQLLRWCKRELPDAIKVSETILKTAVADHIRTTGEVVAGCELAGGAQRLYVK